MITAEIVEAGITRRSIDIERPGRPLWTSNCRSLEGNTITDSIGPKSPLLAGLVQDGVTRYHPKVPVLPSNIQMQLKMPGEQIPEPSDEPTESFNRESLGYTRDEQTVCHATAPKMGKINTRANSKGPV